MVRTAIEVVVLATGRLPGGAVGIGIGIGTLRYALAIGPLIQYLIPRLAAPVPASTAIA